jgi:penicillin-binding protein 2
VLKHERAVEPGIGRDLVLTLDPRLQATAESLLDDAVARRGLAGPTVEPAGGAIVVLDVRSGAILAAASAPRFDPNAFAGSDGARVAALLSDPGHPLFDRATRMAIPPGSVFKVVSAAALVEAAAIDPQERFFCQGYLHVPERQRCAIYRRHGVGHDEVTLGDALAQSCNVYFFHHAGRLGPSALVDWASRFGFGQVTGVDLPGEAAGTLPAPADDASPSARAKGFAEAQMLAIGQGPLEVTPLQVARMMAAVANGGLLVTPHVVSGLGLTEQGEPTAEASAESAEPPIRVPPPRPIPGLHPATLAAIREGLERVVSDPRGTAHATVFLDSIEIAGKTGTAETGEDGAEHAWLAGYAPADRPRVAFAVALEHAGDAAETAGPVAKRLVLRLQELGYFGKR